MPKMSLTLALFFIISAALISSSAEGPLSAQDTRPLSLKQIEQLIESGIDDEIIAREIHERGLAFRLPEATFEQLIKRGAGGQTRQALLLQEERAAYAAYRTPRSGCRWAKSSCAGIRGANMRRRSSRETAARRSISSAPLTRLSRPTSTRRVSTGCWRRGARY
jgi:hypothetical protein